MIEIQQAKVYRVAGGRRFFTLIAACKCEAKKRIIAAHGHPEDTGEWYRFYEPRVRRLAHIYYRHYRGFK